MYEDFLTNIMKIIFEQLKGFILSYNPISMWQGWSEERSWWRSRKKITWIYKEQAIWSSWEENWNAALVKCRRKIIKLQKSWGS